MMSVQARLALEAFRKVERLEHKTEIALAELSRAAMRIPIHDLAEYTLLTERERKRAALRCRKCGPAEREAMVTA